MTKIITVIEHLDGTRGSLRDRGQFSWRAPCCPLTRGLIIPSNLAVLFPVTQKLFSAA